MKSYDKKYMESEDSVNFTLLYKCGSVNISTKMHKKLAMFGFRVYLIVSTFRHVLSNNTNESNQLDNIRCALKISGCTYAIMTFQQIIACYTMLCRFDNARDQLLEISKDSPSHESF